VSGAKIIVNDDLFETRLAVIENGLITGIHISRKGEENLLGNVYLGRVIRVMPGMQAAFVDIGLSRAGFLPGRQVLSPEMHDALRQEAGDRRGKDGEKGEAGPSRKTRRSRRKGRPIEQMLKGGQEVIVQIVQQPHGMKGAKVTTYVSLPGHYCVYMPTIEGVGVSRRISDRKKRARMRKLANRLRARHEGGFIIRTAAGAAKDSEVEREADYIGNLWKEVVRKGRDRKPPHLLFREWDLTTRILRETPDAQIDSITVDTEESYEEVRRYLELAAPQHLERLSRYGGRRPIFDHFGIEQELQRVLRRQVMLPSGGSIVIDQAEALTAIDVNTGSFTGKGRRNQEETITTTNIEAVKAIAYQLKLRNIGGLVILDLIDMEQPENRDRVYKVLIEELEADRAKTLVRPISELGLIEMTRERYGDSPMRLLNEKCWYCDGTGSILSKKTIVARILRAVQHALATSESRRALVVVAHQAVVLALEHEQSDPLEKLRREHRRDIVLEPRVDIHTEYFRIETRDPRGSPGD
jgi:ribonuclease G